MKDKRARQTSINDLVRKHRVNDGLLSQRQIADDNVEESIISQEELNNIYEYNSKVRILDEDYTNIQPLGDVLVRVFLQEPVKTEQGILEPFRQLLPISTPSGVGTLLEVESPYPYSNKAIVVAVPSHYTNLQVGDTIQLKSNPIKPIVTGHGVNAKIFIPAAYLHPSCNSLEVPQDCLNKHYGYLLIPYHEISTKVKF